MFRYKVQPIGSYRSDMIDLGVPAQVGDLIKMSTSVYTYRVREIEHEVEIIDGNGNQSNSSISITTLLVEKV